MSRKLPWWTPPRVRALRHRLNLTQAELAARLTVSVMTVARWEMRGPNHYYPDRRSQAALDALAGR